MVAVAIGSWAAARIKMVLFFYGDLLALRVVLQAQRQIALEVDVGSIGELEHVRLDEGRVELRSVVGHVAQDERVDGAAELEMFQ